MNTSEENGIWVPNRLVDLHQELTAEGILVYLFLARCPTQCLYPTFSEIKKILGMGKGPLERALTLLTHYQLLNLSDLSQIRREGRHDA